MLVTERPGRMRIVTTEGQLSPPLKGVPDVWASGQGGLLDVITDKEFAQNPHHFLLLCRAHQRRRAHSGGPRETQRRQRQAR
jgi:glucose/arabinose dehydrogenase